MRSAETGFSLVELLMGILLIAVLSAIAIPAFINFGTDARDKKTREKLHEIRTAIIGDSRKVAGGQYIDLGFENHVGAAPTSLTQLTTQGALATYNPFTKRGWRGPYLSTTAPGWDQDAWGTTIVVDGTARTIRSWGPNKTGGDADDIVVSF